MTTPPGGERRPDELPPVDTVIHDARSSSWHLTESQPSEVAHPGHAGQPGEPPAPPQDDRRAPTPAEAAAVSAPSQPPASHAAPAAAGHGEVQGEALGPVDVEMWGAGIAAGIVGLVMAICFVLATSGVGAY